MHAPRVSFDEQPVRDDLAELDALKRDLLSNNDYDSVYHRFHSKLGGSDAFFARGSAVREPALEHVLGTVASRVLGTTVKVVKSRLVEIRERDFVHGILDLGGRIAHLVFFRDAFTGILAVLPQDLDGEMQVIRFGGAIIAQRPAPDTN
jgi:hypothetical protein